MPLSYMGSAYSGAGLAGMPLSYTGSSRVLSRSQLPSPRVGAASALLPLPVNVTKNIGTAPSKLGQEDNESFFFFSSKHTCLCSGPLKFLKVTSCGMTGLGESAAVSFYRSFSSSKSSGSIYS